jgi:hypothetical protein
MDSTETCDSEQLLWLLVRVMTAGTPPPPVMCCGVVFLRQATRSRRPCKAPCPLHAATHDHFSATRNVCDVTPTVSPWLHILSPELKTFTSYRQHLITVLKLWLQMTFLQLPLTQGYSASPCSSTPRCNLSSTLYPQSCWCIIQVIYSL